LSAHADQPEAARSAFAMGFDEAGADAVLGGLVEALSLERTVRYCADPSKAPPVERVCEGVSLRSLTFGVAPFFKEYPTERTFDRLSHPDSRFIEAMHMLERYRFSRLAVDIIESPAATVRHVASLFGFWELELQRRSPDLVLFSRLPHDFADFIAYEVCHERGIPTLVMRRFQVERTFDVVLDFRAGTLTEPAEFARGVSRGGVHLSDLPLRFQQEWHNRRSRKPPAYMSNAAPDTPPAQKIGELASQVTSRFASRRAGSSAPDGRCTVGRAVAALEAPAAGSGDAGTTFLRLMTRRLDIRRRAIAARQAATQEREQEIPDTPMPFIYFPLHLQPEATTSPMGGMWVDQALAACTLAEAALPRSLTLKLKENPKQRQHFRGPRFWTEVAGRTNLEVVPQTSDTFELIESSAAVATITGTAGWEGMFLGRGVVLFGHAFYRDGPGVFAVDSVGGVGAAIDKATAYSQRPAAEKDEALLSYLSALARATTEGMALRTTVGGAADEWTPDIIASQNVEAICQTFRAALGRSGLAVTE
jgi:hypothetical protein